jgi:hypothetical protein
MNPGKEQPTACYEPESVRLASTGPMEVRSILLSAGRNKQGLRESATAPPRLTIRSDRVDESAEWYDPPVDYEHH